MPYYFILCKFYYCSQYRRHMTVTNSHQIEAYTLCLNHSSKILSLQTFMSLIADETITSY